MTTDNNSRILYSTDYLTVREAARLLGFKESRIRNMIFKKNIPHYKVGASIRFDKEQLQNWIKTKSVQVEV